jgi:hypothetical protein
MREIYGSNSTIGKVPFSRHEADTSTSFCFFQMILVRIGSEEIVRALHQSKAGP